jgi:hypothetical protein
VWAVAFSAQEYLGADDDGMRGIEVWSAKGCVAQTRIMKDVRPLTIDGSAT